MSGFGPPVRMTLTPEEETWQREHEAGHVVILWNMWQTGIIPENKFHEGLIELVERDAEHPESFQKALE